MSLKPSPLPSVAPGEVPPSCVDDADFEFEMVNFPGTMQDCTWLTKNERFESKRISMYCSGEIKYAGCPSTCGGCDCEDDADFTFTLTNFPDTVKGCSWITQNENNVDTRRDKYCGTEVGDYCPVACGFCS